MSMRFGVLGPLEIQAGGVGLTVPAGRSRAVLGVLLIAAGHVVSADRLIEAVWGDETPADPANTLQQSVARLRRPLSGHGTQPIVTEANGYRIDLTDHELDSIEFERGLARARALLAAGDAAAARSAIEAALELWRGPAYGDFTYDDFATAERERLTNLRLDARELGIDARSTLEGSAAVIADLESLVAEFPYREGLRARLMRGLYAAGRQADALAAYQEARRILGEDLGLEPSPDLRHLEEQILLHDELLTSEQRQHPHNLPTAASSMVGRSHELETIPRLLDEARLVTLLGPGGSGKTRLAIEVAHTVRPSFEAGTWLVRLDDLVDPSLVVNEIAAEIAMPEDPDRDMTDTLATYIGARRMLIVLDNCEHVIDAAAGIAATLLARCPNVQVLATSQQPFHISGEHRFAVEPLPLPGAVGSPFEDLDTVPAVNLFVERARAVRPGFAPDPTEMAAIANIVAALDGMPLAIELAAARTNVLTPPELAARLVDRFSVLESEARDIPNRQRTLENAVAWSVDLLDTHDRACFLRLAVFAGSFDIEAAAAVTAGQMTLDTIGRLVDRSLIAMSRPAGGRSRYRMLETLRQFAFRLLDADHAGDAVRRRHLEHFASVAAELDRGLRGPEQVDALARFGADHDNLRAAMKWSLETGAVDEGVAIAGHTGTYWDWHGDLAEGAMWTARFAAASDDAERPGMARVMVWRAYFEHELGNADVALATAESAVTLAEALGDPEEIAAASTLPAMVLRVRGDLDQASAHNTRARTTASAAGQDWLVAWADNHDALLHLARNDVGAAQSAGQASLERFEAAGDRRATGWALTVLAQVALEGGDAARARDLAVEAAELSSKMSDGRNAGWAYEIAAAATARAGDHEAAAAYRRAATDLLHARGMPRSPWRR